MSSNNEDYEDSSDSFLEGLGVVLGGVVLGVAIAWILSELPNDFFDDLEVFLKDYLDEIANLDNLSELEQAALLKDFSSQTDMKVFEKYGIEVEDLSIEEQAALFRQLASQVTA